MWCLGVGHVSWPFKPSIEHIQAFQPITPGFRRQTECEPSTCHDQKLMYTQLHSWTSSHIAQNKSENSTLLHHHVQDIHRVINLSHKHNQSADTKRSTIRPSQAADWGFATKHN
jgi:hypothetical protein